MQEKSNIVLATHNKGKVAEYRRILLGVNINIYKLKDFGIHEEPEENGKTFEENSTIKLNFYTEKLKKKGLDFKTNLALAEDSGIEIKALKGNPGIHSARYGNPFLDGLQRNKLILKKLKDVPQQERIARFVCVISLWGYSMVKSQMFRGEVYGRISNKISGSNGFGYDPIFVPKGYNETMADLQEQEKDKISHRGVAGRKLEKFLRRLNEKNN